MNLERKLRGKKISDKREIPPSLFGIFPLPPTDPEIFQSILSPLLFFLPHLRAVSAARVPHWSPLSCFKYPTSALFLFSIAACASIFFCFLLRFFFSLFFPRLAFYRFFLILYASIGTCLVCFSLHLFRTRLIRLLLTSPQSNLDSG